jgi:hypothetical protein
LTVNVESYLAQRHHRLLNGGSKKCWVPQLGAVIDIAQCCIRENTVSYIGFFFKPDNGSSRLFLNLHHELNLVPRSCASHLLSHIPSPKECGAIAMV